jgi:SulP family sulfate permease
MKLSSIFPCLLWAKEYRSDYLSSDLIAAVIVTIMLIPQSLAYALLAGLPPETGLYASILPLMAYTIFGTSRTLSVGPVAVASLMTAAAIEKLNIQTGVEYAQAAIILALLSGTFLILMGVLRAGFLANFLSHPVVSGFITASGIIIALSQLKYILGISGSGDNVPALLYSMSQNLGDINVPTIILGTATLLFLFWARSGLPTLLLKTGLSASTAGILSKTAPVIGVIATSALAWWLDLQALGVALTGQLAGGLPSLTLPAFAPRLWLDLLMPAILISIIGYVESVSVGRTLAAKRRQRINSDQELIGLGTANLASGFSGGFPVTGGFSRSVVNFDAGAQTPAAGFFTAIGIALAALYLTDLLAWLPSVTLAATIIVAVLGLVDFSILKKTLHYSRSDFIAVAITMLTTLLGGVEAGVLFGVAASIALHLYKTSMPHMAEVGQIDGTEHFRNIKRHKVKTDPAILSLRVDESLYFPNAAFLEDTIYKNIAEKPQLRHIILMCTAVNEIDYSALEVLEAINLRLQELNIGFHLSEVKGPVMDALQNSDFLDHLNGQVFLTQHQAFTALCAAKTMQADVVAAS